jgi:trehalose/maltose transport system substrate-binding protein
MRKLAFASLLGMGLVLAGAGQPRAVEVSIYCGSQPEELQLCREGTEAWAQQSGNTARVLAAPERSNERYFLYLDLLHRQDASVDVLQIDVIWPSALAPHLVDLTGAVPAATVQEHLPQIIENNTVGGKLVAMPWFTDAGMLYYRKDLLEKHDRPVPATYAELAETARAIQEAERSQGHPDLWGFVFEGNAYEGLTCNALEWIDAYGGGTILDANGRITVANPKAAMALTEAASWIGTITPPLVTRFVEEDARITFQLGNAVFMRNWPYAWALLNAADSPVKDRVGVAPLPKGGDDGRHSAVLGGWQLAVTRYSKAQEAAIDLVTYLTSAAEQKRRAIRGAYAPTIAALYQDPEVLAANPFFGEFARVLDGAVARPSSRTGAHYAQLSTLFWEAAQATLTGRGSAEENLAALAQRLELLQSRTGW